MKSHFKDFIPLIEQLGIPVSLNVPTNTFVLNNKLSVKYIELAQKQKKQHTSADITLHEDIWLNKKKVCISRIASQLKLSKKIHGRETTIKPIKKEDFTQFLNENHLNVSVNPKYKLGMYNKQHRLVGVAGFSRFKKYYRESGTYNSTELVRYCTLLNHTINGGLSKVIQHFIVLYQPDDIVTSIDLEWSNGNGFIANGFRKLKITAPQTFYIDPYNFERHYTQSSNNDRIPILNKGNLRLILDLKDAKK